MDEKIKNCIFSLYHIGAIKFGEFTLKSGISSPIYIDLRLVVSYPSLLRQITDLLWMQIKHLEFECVCGVPYTALPLATVMSIEHTIPMVMRRKEIKQHGTKKIIEGVVQKGKTCLVIEDLITSGSSLFETIEPLEHVGLQVRDVVVLLDRQQGGKQRLEQKGYRVHALLTLTELLNTLKEDQTISSDISDRVLALLG